MMETLSTNITAKSLLNDPEKNSGSSWDRTYSYGMYDSSVKMICTYHAYILMQLIFLKLFWGIALFCAALSTGVSP